MTRLSSEVVDRVLDQGRRPEDGSIGPNPGEAWTQLLERVLDPLGHLEGVRTRKLLDDEQKAIAIVDDRVTDQRLVVDLDVGDIGEAEVAGGSLDGHLAKLLRSRDLVEHVPHLEPLLRGLDEPSGAGC